jgi:hypothetical protein
VRGSGPGNENDPKTFSKTGLMPAHDLAQTTPNTIANYGAAKTPGSDKPGAKRAGIFHREDAKYKQLPPLHRAL